MTPAHIVAGGTPFSVEAGGQTLDGRVLSYNPDRDLANPDRDLAILDVPNLAAPPLSFAAEEAVSGSDATLMGYTDGKVLRVTFGKAIVDPDTGFALTAKEIAPQLADLENTAPVATGHEKC
jgi:hypothetical protein